MSNFKKITNHLYTVENQNGFNNALYDYFQCIDENSKSKKEVREMIQNFPKTYPTTFVIIDQSFECGRVFIEIINSDNCMNEKEIKPIFCVGLPTLLLDEGFLSRISQTIQDYHVVTYPIEKDRTPIFEAFYPKDFDKIEIEKLQAKIFDEIKLLKNE